MGLKGSSAPSFLSQGGIEAFVPPWTATTDTARCPSALPGTSKSPFSQNYFTFSLTKGSCFHLSSNKHQGRRGNLFPQHFNEENTH